MTTAVENVKEEMERFKKALPVLLAKLPGRWVVFRNGVVVGDYATQDEAFVAGLNEFGADGGQVIAQVAAIEPVPLSAAFGIFSC